MNEPRSSYWRQALILSISSLLLQCSGALDGPGMCSLSCGSSIAAPPEASLAFMGFAPNTSLSLACNGQPGRYPKAVPIYFTITQPGQPLPADQIPGDSINLPVSTGSSTNASTALSSALGGISFNVSIQGGVMAPIANPSSSADQYTGIVTPQSQWCTNSCGTGHVDIVPACESSQNIITLLVESGGISNYLTITVNP